LADDAAMKLLAVVQDSEHITDRIEEEIDDLGD
jgi:translation elongation factor EF-1beta